MLEDYRGNVCGCYSTAIRRTIFRLTDTLGTIPDSICYSAYIDSIIHIGKGSSK